MRTPNRWVALAFCLVAAVASAQSRVVQVDRDKPSVEFKESVKGDASVDYKVDVNAGQTMTVKLDAKKAYFNIIEPNAGDVAIYNSSTDMNAWTSVAKHTGQYTVRVYLMREEARRGTSDAYTLKISLR